jgi:mevalonate kinase
MYETMVKRHSYYSNGKLLLTGEYLVLKGALAFALPLKYGQLMEINETVNASMKGITWNSFVNQKLWFSGIFDPENFHIIRSSDAKIAVKLQNILQKAKVLNPDFYDSNMSYSINIKSNFKIEWGFGSSSTLLSNVAFWAGIDPFELNRLVSSGSGYDIASARSNSAIFYQLTEKDQHIEKIQFSPAFSGNIYFIYLDVKQSTEDSIEDFNQNTSVSQDDIIKISNISQHTAHSRTIDEFAGYINEHEELMSQILNKQKVKEKYFRDFQGAIKSLGAWGGDFVMAVSELPEKDIINYFKEKGFSTILHFDDIVIK